MSLTRKDSTLNSRCEREFKVVKNGQTYDFFQSGNKAFAGISETYLGDTLCTEWGFCGEELRAVIEELDRNGTWSTIL